MYDPTRLELIRSREDDRRRALAAGAQRRQAAPDVTGRVRRPSIRLARFLRRTADRLEHPVIVLAPSKDLVIGGRRERTYGPKL